MHFSVIAILPMLLLAGCPDATRQAPALRGSGPGSSELEQSHSLPRGAAVDAPVTGRIGNTGKTRFGPTALEAARAVLFATSGY